MKERQLFIIENTKLNIVFPEDNNKYILTYREASEEQVRKEIRFNTCRTFINKKEIINLFNINRKVQIVTAKKIKLKPYDKILIRDANNKFIILELVETKTYYRILATIRHEEYLEIIKKRKHHLTK